MRKTGICTILLLVLGLVVSLTKAGKAVQMGTAWTYQGRLIDANGPADGLYDLQFALYTDPILSGSKIGPTIDVNELDVIDGYFTVELDFGNKVFNGDARWLEIGVRPWDSVQRHTLLSPRQEVTPTPYSLYAAKAANADTDNDWMVSGNDMYSMPSGNIGVGTTTPVSSLEVISPVDTHAIRAISNYIPVYAVRTATTGTWPAVVGDCNSEATGASGVRGRILSTSPGALSAGVYGHNYGTGIYGVGVRGVQDGTGAGVYGVCADGKGVYGVTTNGYAGYFVGGKNYFQGNVGIGTISPSGVLYTNSKNLEIEGTAPSIVLDDTDGSFQNDFEIVNGGDKVLFRDATAGVDVMVLELSGARNTVVRALEITGGADLSERFEVGAEGKQIKPGMVVCIDPENPGGLVVSKKTYDRTVAGIVSGAGGVKTGMLMGQEGTKANGEHPVALSGRVYCWADASKSAIELGDLLTTSDTPGHAMKVTDYNKSHGATLGKAMTSLKEGKGLVLVLVSLQ